MEIEKGLLENIKKDNHEFKKLYEEHLDLKNKVEELNKMKFLTAEQEAEKKKIQLHKLSLKDQLASIVSQYEANLH